MKKISLVDKFSLTDKFMNGEISLVLEEAIPAEGKDSVKQDGRYFEFSDGERVHCRFAEGDAVAVMMSYKQAGLDPKIFGYTEGWEKKRFALDVYMPHRMIVKEVKCVRAQDITLGEALRAGLHMNKGGYYTVGGNCGGIEQDWKKLFMLYFDLLLKHPYRANPWVVMYEVTPVIGNAFKNE